MSTSTSSVSEYFGFPELRQISFYIWHLEFDERDQGEIITPRPNGESGHSRYRISDLYRDKRNARRALLAAQKKWLHEKAAAVNKLEQEIKGGERESSRR